MSSDHEVPLKYEFFRDRTLVCNPQYTHENTEETSTDCVIQMEHSYSRDTGSSEKTMTTHTILVHKPPPCPSCHNTTAAADDLEMIVDVEEDFSPTLTTPSQTLPPVEIERAREAMEEIGGIAAKAKNRNLEEDDWEELVDKSGWTIYQLNLFAKLSNIMAMDRLARLTFVGNPQEPILRRAAIDKGVSRMRKALATVHWDLKLTQWLHGLLVDHLPVSYMTSYMDLLQTLHTKCPSLVEKMVQGRSNELLEAVFRQPWQPKVESKDRQITPEPIIVIVPSGLTNGSANSPRMSRWLDEFRTMSKSVQQLEIPEGFYADVKITLADYVERLVTWVRMKLHEIRKEHPMRAIILAGFNAGSAMALQVASLEQNISSVLCMGFSTQTLRGTRGHLDDRIVELKTPVLFVVGQNSARTSQEEMEHLREQMIAQTALVVVGSANETLHVPYAKRKLEGVTQAMVDRLIMDEVAEFASNCIANPPSPVKKRPVINATTATVTPSPAVIILEDVHQGQEPKKPKSILNGALANALVRKQKSPAKIGRIAKKKVVDRNGVALKMSPPKKEYAERVALTSTGGTTSYEIVTGKLKQNGSVRQMVDGGFIQIATGGGTGTVVGAVTDSAKTTVKWKGGTPLKGLPNNNSMVKNKAKKISLGHFAPMRSSSVSGGLLKSKLIGGVGVKPPKVLETIDLDTDEEDTVVQIEGDTDGTATGVDLVTDISELPIVFQDSEGNLQEPIPNESTTNTITNAATKSTGNVIVTSHKILPKQNKYIYYKPQQTIVAKGGQTQYVVLSNSDIESSGGTPTVLSSSKPLIISVESVDKGGPNTVYHVVEDSEKEE